MKEARDKSPMIPFTGNTQSKQIHAEKANQWFPAAPGWEVGRDALWAGLPLEVLKVSWNLIEVTVSQHSECSKYNLTVPFKVVNVMLCEFYLNEERKL